MRLPDGTDFNSATALKPWRTPSPLRTRNLVFSLQFGHGVEAVENNGTCTPCAALNGHFNSATALKPWRTAGEDFYFGWGAGLQFGHGVEAVENHDLGD